MRRILMTRVKPDWGIHCYLWNGKSSTTWGDEARGFQVDKSLSALQCYILQNQLPIFGLIETVKAFLL